MAGVTGSQRVTYIILRFLRTPIIVLIAVYSISMAGWSIIPGEEVDGVAEPLSLFHAFYYLAYTATTTGFGELPRPFTDAQRMWAMISLYAGVIAWLYAISAIVRLMQNPHFQQSIAERRFARSVAKLPGPFVIVCGFGNTGSLLTRGLDEAGIDAVILDRDPDRIYAVFLRDYHINTPTLCADARIPNRLIEAGLTRPNCSAIVALTNDEEVNVKVAVAARLLNSRARVIIHSQRDTYADTLSTLGPAVRVVDPFQTYARYLSATIHNPLVHMLDEWLVGAPHASLAMYPEIPRGRWIVCGYGRMGRFIHEALCKLHIPTVVIDPSMTDEEGRTPHMIRSRATQTALTRASIANAVGIVAGTDNDPENLGIVVNARALNPDIFVVVRQNQYRNQVLFNAAEAELIMQPNLVSARRILFMLVAPLLRVFFEYIRERQLHGEDEFLRHVIEVLHERIGERRPRLWTTVVNEVSAHAVCKLVEHGAPVTLGDIVREPSGRKRSLACVALVVRSGDAVTVMPKDDHKLNINDELLFCGIQSDRWLLEASLNNEYTLQYLLTGRDVPRSLLMRWLMPDSASSWP
ncbi:MAG: potassium channel family protein [Hyphomicrobiales bacterium]|nr:potassium channel family protein [Hyphomicrobiales bacterium]